VVTFGAALSVANCGKLHEIIKKSIFPLTRIILFLFMHPHLVRISYESSSFSKYFKTTFTVRILCLVNDTNHRPDWPWWPSSLLHNG